MKPRAPQLGGVVNAFFSGVKATPILALAGAQDITVTVAPTVAGDTLAAGERISVVMPTNMPAGLCIGGGYVSAPNTVVIRCFAVIAVGSVSATWLVTAHR